MLKTRHEALGALYATAPDDGIVEYAAGADREYRTAHAAAVLADRSLAGRIEVSGADRVEFLQRMSTNDMRNCPDGAGLQTVLTTPEGRIVDLLTVCMQAEKALVLTSLPNRRIVGDWFRRNIFFRDKVKVSDVTDHTCQFMLVGPQASALLAQLGAGAHSDLSAWHTREITISGSAVTLMAHPQLAGGGFDLIASGASGPALWDTVMAAGAEMGVLPIGSRALEMLRIEAGIPAAGAELGDDVNPLEAGLRDAVSFSKGCYTGQEVIARVENYQKLKQALVCVHLDTVPAMDLPLPLVDGEEVGRLTSCAALPGQPGAIGLGYVRAKHIVSGASFGVGPDGCYGMATITPLDSLQTEATR
ncbi:MAG: aminomethyl transferase family protein [Chloroflexi bacterium]|nr:aminomethyl transferase family protein [Chloroflexota bacterium]